MNLEEVTDPSELKDLGLEEVTDPTVLNQFSAPPTSNWRAPLNGAIGAVAGGVDDLVNFPTNVTNLAKAGYGAAATLLGRQDLAPQVVQPDMSATDFLLQRGILKPRSSETTVGKVLDFAGGVVAGGGLNPRSVLGSIAERNIPQAAGQLVRPVVGGVAGGAAQQAAEKVAPNSTLAQTAAGVAGTLLGQKVVPHPNTIEETAHQALHNVTPQQLQEAQKLMHDAAAMGTPITGADAIAKVTGGNPLQAVQRVVEQSGGGSPVMTPFMNPRAANNQTVFEQTLNNSLGNAAPSPEVPVLVYVPT